MATIKKSWLAGFVMALVLAGTWSAFTLRSNEISADQKGGTMRVVRLYTGPDNKSHFEDIQVPLKMAARSALSPNFTKPPAWCFARTPGTTTMTFTPRHGGSTW